MIKLPSKVTALLYKRNSAEEFMKAGRILLFVFFALVTLDCITTVYGLQFGLLETNKGADFLYQNLGAFGLALHGLSTMALAGLIVAVPHKFLPRYSQFIVCVFLSVMIGIFSTAILNNILYFV